MCLSLRMKQELVQHIFKEKLEINEDSKQAAIYELLRT